MIYLKTEEEIELLRENNLLVSATLAEVGRHIKPGITTRELDAIAEEFIRSHGAVPAFLGYSGYPATLCISVNEQIVHGIPSDYALKEGDIVEAMVHAASDTILTCELPANVVLEITYTEPGIKGDTATNTLKPATVETGAEVRVPLFVNEGDMIEVDTRDGSYISRVKA